MSHRVIIINQKVQPSGDALVSAESSELDAQVTYKPSHDMTDTQVGNAIERILKRLNKLADD